MSKINAKIIADSIDTRGNRLISYVLTYPRFIHSELMTHRMFSRNSASSRAIPFKKMIKMIEEDPFIPIAWQFDHKGMQGNEYVTEESDYGGIEARTESWLQARDFAIQQAEDLSSMDTTKQLCNRLLEPFMWHTVLVTATEWDNFFELRCPKYINEHENGEDISYSRKDFISKLKKRYPTNWESDLRDFHGIENNEDWEWARLSKSDAEIHIQILAEAMWDARNESTPKQLKAGEWHIPFLDTFDNFSDLPESSSAKDLSVDFDRNDIKIATARCARLSYMTHDNKIDYLKDIELHDRLLSAHHMSPFEHCAKMMSDEEYYSFIKGQVPTTKDEDGIINYEYYPFVFKTTDESGYQWIGFEGENPNNNNRYGWCLNFRGFIPYRYFIEDGTI